MRFIFLILLLLFSCSTYPKKYKSSDWYTGGFTQIALTLFENEKYSLDYTYYFESADSDNTIESRTIHLNGKWSNTIPFSFDLPEKSELDSIVSNKQIYFSVANDTAFVFGIPCFLE